MQRFLKTYYTCYGLFFWACCLCFFTLVYYTKVFLLKLSIVFNRLLGGEVNQTFSTRNWVWKRQNKFNLVFVIDKVLGQGHCMESWIKWIIKNKK